MTEFYKFPSTPHLFPPSGVDVRGDKILTVPERRDFLSHPLHVEEKVDGENLGVSCDGDELLFQARGSHVRIGGKHFRGLETWVRPRAARIVEAIGTDLILFGEWCAATHTVRYDALPDWYLVFDVYQRSTGRFWATGDRDAFVADLGLFTVPFVAAGSFDENGLSDLITTSRLGREPMEGVVARVQDSVATVQRAKVVRSGFVQQIEQHWTSGARSMNQLTGFSRGRPL